MSTPAGSSRCAAHLGRPAVDLRPVCPRPRCGADVLGGSCAVCRGGSAPDRRPAAGPLELLVRAALAANAVAVAWGYVTAEYVGTDLFTYLSPAVLGALCGAAARAATRQVGRSPIGSRVRAVAVGYALVGVALAFLLEGTYAPLSLELDVLVAYVIAAGAAWLWTAPGWSLASS